MRHLSNAIEAFAELLAAVEVVGLLQIHPEIPVWWPDFVVTRLTAKEPDEPLFARHFLFQLFKPVKGNRDVSLREKKDSMRRQIGTTALLQCRARLEPRTTQKRYNKTGENRKQLSKTSYIAAYLAPQVGFEPTTLRLTAECSTIELLRSAQNNN
jgi:hypothetical protein